MPPKKREPRFKSSRVPGSEPSSDDDESEHVTLFRALHPSELDDANTAGAEPRLRGADGGSAIRTKPDAVAKLPGAHVHAGTKAHQKSTWVSFTKSARCAAAWSTMPDTKSKQQGSFAVAKMVVPVAALKALPPVEVKNPAFSIKATTANDSEDDLAEEFETALRVSSSKARQKVTCAGTATFPAVIDYTRDVATLPAPVTRGDDANLAKISYETSLGTTGINAAKSSREVLIGSTRPDAVVVAAKHIACVAKVRVLSAGDDAALLLQQHPTWQLCQARAQASQKAAERYVIMWPDPALNVQISTRRVAANGAGVVRLTCRVSRPVEQLRLSIVAPTNCELISLPGCIGPKCDVGNRWSVDLGTVLTDKDGIVEFAMRPSAPAADTREIPLTALEVTATVRAHYLPRQLVRAWQLPLPPSASLRSPWPPAAAPPAPFTQRVAVVGKGAASPVKAAADALSALGFTVVHTDAQSLFAVSQRADGRLATLHGRRAEEGEADGQLTLTVTGVDAGFAAAIIVELAAKLA